MLLTNAWWATYYYNAVTVTWQMTIIPTKTLNIPGSQIYNNSSKNQSSVSIEGRVMVLVSCNQDIHLKNSRHLYKSQNECLLAQKKLQIDRPLTLYQTIPILSAVIIKCTMI